VQNFIGAVVMSGASNRNRNASNRNRDTSDEEDDRRENKSKKPRGEPPRSSLEREELPLSIFLLQLYFKGNFGNPPRVFTRETSGKSSRPPKPDRTQCVKVHTWGESWRTDKSRCPFVHCVVRLRSKAQAQYDEFGRPHWALFIEALARHLQLLQIQANDLQILAAQSP
jgi:hypothetical protein